MISTALAGSLKNPALLLDAGFVAGEWLATAEGGKTFDVLNPSTGDVLATLPDMGIPETKRAIDAAYATQVAWAKRTG